MKEEHNVGRKLLRQTQSFTYFSIMFRYFETMSSFLETALVIIMNEQEIVATYVMEFYE